LPRIFAHTYPAASVVQKCEDVSRVEG
jgi:hypothetical protein